MATPARASRKSTSPVDRGGATGRQRERPEVIRTPETTLEIVSDSGEGAQKCGQIFGSVCAKMGNGAWTVEIIPAEIRPPPRTPAGGSGNRIRFQSD